MQRHCRLHPLHFLVGAPRNVEVLRQSLLLSLICLPVVGIMPRSVSRGASPAVSTGKSHWSVADKVKSAAAAYYQPLDAKYPDCVGVPSDSRGYSKSSPDLFISSFQCQYQRQKCRTRQWQWRQQPCAQGVSSLMLQISSRARSVEPRGWSVAGIGTNSRLTTPQAPGRWDQPASPPSTDEVFEKP